MTTPMKALPDYSIARFEGEYPQRAAWLMAWYAKHEHLPGFGPINREWSSQLHIHVHGGWTIKLVRNI